MNCPICHSPSRRLFQKHQYWIRGCKTCKHQFAELRLNPGHADDVYNDRYFQGGGAGYSDYVTEATLLRRHGQRYGRLLNRYTSPGLMLDVGAAAGFILQGFLDCGWQGEGLEPNPRMADYARTELGLQVETGTLEELQTQTHYDLLTTIQVVPHFFDLRQAFQAAGQLTKVGGFWLIETWNRNSWTARILGQNWHEYSPPSVLHWFSPAGLQQLAAQFGFQAVARGRPQKWINGGHAKSLLRYKLQDLKLQDLWWGRLPTWCLNLVPDNFLIPYLADDLFWMLFQRL